MNNKLRSLGAIFNPLLSGFIIAGFCSGFASLIAQLVPDYSVKVVWNAIYIVLSMSNTAFTAYIAAWVGYSASVNFKGNPITGGLLGMVTSLEGINLLSQLVGLYNAANPAASILRAGSGGVMTVIFSSWLLSKVEKRLHSYLPLSLDSVLTPFFSFLICLVPTVFVFMPSLGFVANMLYKGLEFLIFNDSWTVRLISGYICAALFLPCSVFGLQFAFIAIYIMQLEAVGNTSLYPVLAMAGASQVGTAVMVFIKARKAGLIKLQATAAAGIFPGMLGVGSALLYGISVPYARAFLATCLGAGFGGAFIVISGVSSTGWGPSGLLASPLMTAGVGTPVSNMLHYLMGLAIACTAGLLLASVLVRQKDLA